MMERRLGEVFYDYGRRIKVVESDTLSCAGCAYAVMRGAKLCSKKYGYVGDCMPTKREDRTNVIFVVV